MRQDGVKKSERREQDGQIPEQRRNAGREDSPGHRAAGVRLADTLGARAAIISRSIQRRHVPAIAHVVGLVQMKLVGFRIVGENLGIAAPLQSRFDLAVDFHLRESFVEQVAKEFQRHGVIRFFFQSGVHLLQERSVLQRRVAENFFARGNIGFGIRPALRQ